MRIFISIILFGLIVLGCNSNTDNDKAEKAIDNAMEKSAVMFDPEYYKAEDIVFYNLFSPVDLTYLVNESSAYYNSQLINPLNNITKYSTSSEIALNLGIYGADLSYLWMFDQTQQALSYLTAIQRLADQLEIPREFVDFTYIKAESQSQDIDTLIKIARDTYYTAEEYLNETGREHAAALILLGGWIETMHIATKMNAEPKGQMASRIASQQFSLNSLYSLLRNHQDDIEMTEYLLLLKKLKGSFDAAQLTFPKGSLLVDTVGRRIFVAPNTEVQLSKEDFIKIRQNTNVLRKHIVQ